MCRFLLAKSKLSINPEKILKSFAKMAKKSKAYDGDWQGDGWGFSWLKDDKWQIYKSIRQKNKNNYFSRGTIYKK